MKLKDLVLVTLRESFLLVKHTLSFIVHMMWNIGHDLNTGGLQGHGTNPPPSRSCFDLARRAIRSALMLARTIVPVLGLATE